MSEHRTGSASLQPESDVGSTPTLAVYAFPVENAAAPLRAIVVETVTETAGEEPGRSAGLSVRGLRLVEDLVYVPEPDDGPDLAALLERFLEGLGYTRVGGRIVIPVDFAREELGVDVATGDGVLWAVRRQTP